MTGTFVFDGHFEGYANNPHKVLSGHQRAQDGTNTQSFTFALVDELKGKASKLLDQSSWILYIILKLLLDRFFPSELWEIKFGMGKVTQKKNASNQERST